MLAEERRHRKNGEIEDPEERGDNWWQKFPCERGGDCAKNRMKWQVTEKRIGPPLLESRWREGGKWKSFCMPINVIVGFREVMQK